MRKLLTWDLENDPIEVNNLAADPDANQDLILAMNEKLNALIATEIGADNGDFLPDKIKNRQAVIMDSVDQFDP